MEIKNTCKDFVKACGDGDLKSVRYLVEEMRCDVNCEDRFLGRTPLTQASMRGHYHIVKYLLRKGADPNMKQDFTPLFSASINGYFDIVELLIHHEANVNMLTIYEDTVLDIFKRLDDDEVKDDHPKIIELLKEEGAVTSDKLPVL